MEKLSFTEVKASRPVPTLKQDVCDYMMTRPRELPPKYFYDETGSKLFDQICDVPEYYPTRTEHALLRKHADKIIAITKPDHIIEFGSGTSRKTRLLLDACQQQGIYCSYWAMDICAEVLRESANHLRNRYRWLPIHILCGDHNAGLGNIRLPAGPVLAAFLGQHHR